MFIILVVQVEFLLNLLYGILYGSTSESLILFKIHVNYIICLHLGANCLYTKLMKENTRKTSMFVWLSIVVVVVFILLLKQCSENKSTREAVTNSASSINNIKKEIIEDDKKKDLIDKMYVSESKQEGTNAVASSLIDKKGVVSKATKKSNATSPKLDEGYKAAVKKESQVNFSEQSGEGIGEEQKPKTESALKKELGVLTAKVNILEEKIKALWERLRLFSEEKQTRLLAEKYGAVEKEERVDSTDVVDTLKNDVFRYPTHVLAGGLSTYEKWTGYGFQASYTYRINKHVSLGVQSNGFLKEGKYNGDRDFYLGFRANFHVFPFFVENSRFDLYTGGTAGMGRDDDVETFETMWYLGAAYDFNKHWGVFVEAGNIGAMGFRLTF